MNYPTAKDTEQLQLFKRPGVITLLYFLISVFWILWSDSLIDTTFGNDLLKIRYAQTIKGLAFVLLSSVFLYYMVIGLYKALVGRNEEIDLLVRNSDLSLLKLNERLEVDLMSHNILDLLDYSLSDAKGKSIFTFVEISDQPLLHSHFTELQNGNNEKFNAEIRIKGADNEIHWVGLNFIVKKKNKKVDYFMAAVQNLNRIKRSEAKLKDELVQKKSLINSTTDLIWSVDRDLRLVSYNDSFADIANQYSGRTGENASNLNDVTSRWLKHYYQALDGDSLKILDEISLGGNKEYYESKFNPIYRDGKAIGVSCFSRNITKLMNQRVKLKRNQQFLQTIFDTANIGIAIVMENGRIQEVNARMCDMLDYQESELMDKPLSEVVDERERKRSIREFLNQLDSTSDHQSKKTYRKLKKADGSLVEVMLFSSVMISHGKKYVVYCVADLTEKLESARKLKEKDEYLQILFENASEAILSVDAEGKIQMYNKKLVSWFGKINQTLLSDQWIKEANLYSPGGDKITSAGEFRLIQLLKDREAIEDEFMIKMENGHWRHIEAVGSALFDNNDQRIGAVILLRDVSERVNRNMQIANAIIDAIEKERTEISSEIHDNVVQLLSIVNMRLKNMKLRIQALKGDEEYEKVLNYMVDVIETCRKIAHKIMPRSVEDFGLFWALRELEASLKETLPIEVDFQNELDFRFDPNQELQLYRIIQEATQNILKHAEADRIQIKTSFKSGTLNTTIADNGKGFDHNNMRVSGIGLRTMKNRARRIGADLKIRSGPKGTTVRIKHKIPEADHG